MKLVKRGIPMIKTLFHFIVLLIIIVGVSCSNDELFVDIYSENLPDLGITKITVQDLNNLEIEFNYDIIEDSVSTINNYEISRLDNPDDKLVVHSAVITSGASNKVKLSVQTMQPQSSYQIKISGIRSQNALINEQSGLVALYEVGNLIDQSPVWLFQPTDQSVVQGYPYLSWSSRTGATNYTIEITSETLENNGDIVGDFSSPLVQIEVDNTVLMLSDDLFVLDTIEYFWRVRANYGDIQGEFSMPNSFNVVTTGSEDDAVYVNSGYIGMSCGNKSKPFKTIQDGVDFASDHGISTVYVASGLYLESVIVRTNVSIYGSYNPEDWTPRVDFISMSLEELQDFILGDNASKVESIDGASFVFGNLTDEASTIQGFNISGKEYGIKIWNSSLTVQNNIFFIQNAVNVVEINNKAEGQLVSLEKNLMFSVGGAGDPYSYVVQSNAPLNVSKNIFTALEAQQDSYLLYIAYGINDFATGSLIINNIFNAAAIEDDSTAIFLFKAKNSLIANNYINAGDTNTGEIIDIYMEFCDSIQISNNLITLEETSPAVNRGIQFVNNSNLSIKNNNFYDMDVFGYDSSGNCTTNYDGDGNDYTCNIQDLEALSAISASGNLSEDISGYISTGDLAYRFDNEMGPLHLDDFNFDTGGLDGAALGWEFSSDILGLDRTGNGSIGWSIGPNEYD